MLVKDFIGKKKAPKGSLGLELEVEQDTPVAVLQNEFWNTKDDASLRATYNAEYVSPKPLEIDQALKAIRQIGWELGQKKHKVLTSPRTSFHVHVNVSDLNLTEYWTYAMSYWLVEDLLFNFLDANRKGNCFCLRLSDADGVLVYCRQDIQSGSPFSHLRGEAIRYAAMNLAATPLQGSVEFRGMEGKVNQDKMETWVTELYNLKLYSKKFKSPSALLDTYFKEDVNTFLPKLFSPGFIKTICIGDWRQKLLDSAGSLVDICYMHDWEAWRKRTEETFQEKPPKFQWGTIQDENDVAVPVNEAHGRIPRGAAIRFGNV